MNNSIISQLWLRSDIRIGPFETPPNEQRIAELLAKHPWVGFSTTGDIPFRWDFVDRPGAGTALIAFIAPLNRPSPPDGLRYLSQERSTVTRHTVSCPTQPQNPGQISNVEVELECLTSLHGHLPPFSAAQPLDPGSPETRLTRYRRRYHITSGTGHAGLWLYYWGIVDDASSAPACPPGWDAEPVRNYPLPLHLRPTEPVAVFPTFSNRNVLVPGVTTDSALNVDILTRSFMPASTPAANGSVPSLPPPGNATPQQVHVSLPPGIVPNSNGVGAPPPHSFLTPQQQAIALAQAQAQAQAAHQNGSLPSNGLQVPNGMPPNTAVLPPHQQQLYAAQMQAHVAAQQQRLNGLQQQQQQHQQQHQQKRPTGPSVPGLLPQTQHPEIATDAYDHLNTRQLAISRLAANNAFMTELVDPWTLPQILEQAAGLSGHPIRVSRIYRHLDEGGIISAGYGPELLDISGNDNKEEGKSNDKERESPKDTEANGQPVASFGVERLRALLEQTRAEEEVYRQKCAERAKIKADLLEL